jgi:hypothetical protein
MAIDPRVDIGHVHLKVADIDRALECAADYAMDACMKTEVDFTQGGFEFYKHPPPSSYALNKILYELRLSGDLRRRFFKDTQGLAKEYGLNAKESAALETIKDENIDSLRSLKPHPLVDAGAHHLTSLVLHAANTLLVFLTWRRLTGALARAAMTAVLFGLHPMHVESVAWVTERKDVLCALFWFLAIFVHARAVEAPSTRRRLVVAAASSSPTAVPGKTHR